MTNWTLYSRAGCGLCEEFMVELTELVGPHASAINVVDVDADAETRRRYGDKVPVLVVDGDFVCAIRVDPERISRLLDAESGASSAP